VYGESGKEVDLADTSGTLWRRLPYDAKRPQNAAAPPITRELSKKEKKEVQKQQKAEEKQRKADEKARKKQAAQDEKVRRRAEKEAAKAATTSAAAAARTGRTPHPQEMLPDPVPEPEPEPKPEPVPETAATYWSRQEQPPERVVQQLDEATSASPPQRYEALTSAPVHEQVDLKSKKLDKLSQGETIVALATQEVDGIVRVQCSLGWVSTTGKKGKVLLKALTLPSSTETMQPSSSAPGAEPADDIIVTEAEADEDLEQLNQMVDPELEDTNSENQQQPSVLLEGVQQSAAVLQPDDASAVEPVEMAEGGNHGVVAAAADKATNALLTERTADEEWSGVPWHEIKTVLLKEKSGAVVTAEGAVWWPQAARPPLTAKQKRAVKKREKLQKKMAAQAVTEPEPEPEPTVEKTPLKAEAPPAAEVVAALADLVSEVEAIIEVEEQAKAVTAIAAVRRGNHARKLSEDMKQAAAETAAKAAEVPQRYKVLSTTVVRKQAAVDSAKAGKLSKGKTIVALSTAIVADGVTRVQFDGGWVNLQAKSGKALLKLLPPPEPEPEPEPEPALPYETPWLTREPDPPLPPDTLEERLAQMDALGDRWEKRTKIEERSQVKTPNMVTVPTFMGEKYSFNLKTADELVHELSWFPPPVAHALSTWFREIGLGHKEPLLQDKIYDDRFEDEFLQGLCGSNGMTFMESLDGERIAGLIELLELSEQAEVVYRKELYRRTGRAEHAPLPGTVDDEASTESSRSPKGDKKKKKTAKKKPKKNGSKKKGSRPSSRGSSETTAAGAAAAAAGSDEPHEETAKEQFERIMREEAAAAKAAEELQRQQAEAAQAALMEESERAAGRGKGKKKKKKAASPKPKAVAATSDTPKKAAAKSKPKTKKKKKK
jgi:hypothetical protein